VLGVVKVSEIFGRLRYSWLVSRLIEEEEECCLVAHPGVLLFQYTDKLIPEQV
jgi:hypothetical protein